MTTRIPARLPLNKKPMEFLIFVYTFLPLATALTMVAKLSSVRIIAAASLETSVPVMPIAMPMSACLRAGASFTPSPVIAVMQPFSCHARTMRILCSGERARKPKSARTFSFSSSSVMRSSSAPSTARSPSCKIPIFFCNRRSRYLMVTRNHHRADTCAAAVGNRCGGFLTRRVHHGNQTHKGKVIFIL